MSKVELELATYDALQHNISAKAARIDALEKQLQMMKDAHEAEIVKLVEQGKVRVVEKYITPISTLFWFLNKEENVEPKYKGFDDVKQEVYEHFKQCIFKEELEKQKQEQLESVFKQLQDKEETISGLKAEIERLKGRTLLERIRNK